MITLTIFVLAVVSANTFTPAQVKFQQETLTHHNQVRARHCVSLLQLDDKLSQTAQKYAEYLASNNTFEHSNSSYGENLYMKLGSMSLVNLTGNVASQSWYDEIKDYNYSKPDFSMKTGHFTQLVWKDSQKLGVGIAFANNEQKAVVVANYDPSGNYLGQFDKQVLPAKC